jgi:hypothetical protein
MKRYYINHFSGMTTDAEFVEVRDQLVRENRDFSLITTSHLCGPA